MENPLEYNVIIMSDNEDFGSNDEDRPLHQEESNATSKPLLINQIGADMEESKKKKLHIPNDISINILLRLPAKSLVRFTCVCKPWQSFLSQLKLDNKVIVLDTLAAVYQINEFDHHQVSSVHNEIDEVCIDFPPHNRIYVCKIIGSCNGLLCLVISCNYEGFALWNPWTNRLIKTAKVPVADRDDVVCPYEGFGYDKSTDDYKIVSFCFTRKVYEMYSLRKDCWKKITLPFPAGKQPTTCFFDPQKIGTFVNGALYWKVSYPDGYKIVCFHLVDNNFSEILLPDDIISKPQPEFVLGVLSGRLCMVNYLEERYIEILALEEEKKWTKLIRWDGILNCGCGDKHYLSPVCCIMKNQLLINFRTRNLEGFPLLSKHRQFFLLNPEAKTAREFKIQNLPSVYQCTSYTPTLVSPVHIHISGSIVKNN